ncbi:AraC family transcriptional regulator [Microvirga arsenatis]|uniref:Helix-turn-helix domain-containing protein n=1 Tax=Microvirga arsenatis TaxID=2692265 RepID=A0ABW9YVW6_9HYPH|nr:helix-turn-helix transcriptional regulator [Microvirga arsenatis]NBJ10683.1 helix-turn-helix domain-containing protein [Microvirga arsenatis]NBJ24419.1 helix-turn-helix domain-containing protein [Microvirga arsenatis]
MRNLHIDTVDHVPRPILALGRVYPDRFTIKPHHHRRGQLISSASGVIVLTTPEGTYVMPPQRGMWIPPGTVHHVRMVGTVSMQSLYPEPDAVSGMPERCQVVGISPFMRSLMTEALNLPLEYELDGRAGALMELIRHEMQQLPILPLSLHYPTDGPLAERCRQFIQQPAVHETIDDWSTALGMSRRAFTRLFRRETGLSFMAWRQQACLLCAMPRLAAGEAVTTVAMDLGYENPAAFTIMFKRAFGSPPLAYLGLRNNRAPTAPA